MDLMCRFVPILLVLQLGISNIEGISLAVNVRVANGWDNLTEIRISDSLELELNITVPIGTFTLTSLITGSDDIFTFCDADVVSIGSNFNNIQPSDFTPSIGTETGVNGTVLPYGNRNVSINFGSVENTGSEVNDTLCSTITVRFTVIVLDSTNFVHNAMVSIDAQANIDNDVATGQRTFTAIIHDLLSITPPIANVTGPGPVLIGDVANWTVVLDLQDGVNKIHIDAWINGTYEYPACDIYIEEIGSAFGCFYKQSAVSSSATNVTSLTIPTVVNTAYNQGMTVATGTYIILKVLSRIPLYASINDQLWGNVDVYLDDKLAFPLSDPIILDDSGSINSPSGTPTVVVDTLTPVTTIVSGSGLVFSVDVGTVPGELSVFDIDIIANPGVVKVCDVQLMTIGSNLCMDHNVSLTLSSSGNNDFYDIANINTGSVLNLQPQSIAADPGNKFRLEVAVCLPEDTNKQNGDNLLLSVKVFYDINAATRKVTGSKTYNVATDPDPSLATDGFNISGSSNVLGFISDTVYVYFTATFSETTDHYTLNVSVPVIGGTALAFVDSVRILGVGSGLVCMENRTMVVVDNSTVSYSQVHSLTVDSGTITYAGLQEKSPFSNFSADGTGINQVTFEVSLVVADHVVNTAGSLIPVTAVLEGATGFSATNTSYLDVQISGTETPMIDFNFAMEQFVYSDKMSGDTVDCSINLILKDTSTAHAQSVVIHVMSPYYVGFGGVYFVEGANVTAVQYLPEPGFDLMIGEIDFKDNITIIFSMILDPNRVMPSGTTNIRTVVPVDITYTGELRGDRTDVGVLYSGYIVNEFGFNAELPVKLGIESGSVLDCQMQASSYLSTHPPYNARLYVTNGWKPSRRGGPFCGQEYLQVNLGSSAYITTILVESTKSSSSDVIGSFQLQYSDDAMAWYDVTEDDVTPSIFTITVQGGANLNTVYTRDLTDAQRFTAQYVRLISRVCIKGVRIELKGLQQTGTPVDCNSQVMVPVSIVPEQSYVINGITGTMFVCGLTGVGKDVRCSRSEDGDAWQALDESVANIVAVVSNTTIVVAKTGYISTYLLSDDDGYTWYSVTDEIVTEIQSLPGYTLSIDLPYSDYSGVSKNNMYDAHGILGPNGLKMTGLMEGIALNSGAWNIKAWWGTDDWSSL